MEHNLDLSAVLQHIDPTQLSYQDWCNIGMALKHEGYSVAVWDDWSRNDPARYHPDDCARKWQTFKGSASPVTGGTIVQLAKEQGWSPVSAGHEIGWGDVIANDLQVIDSTWLEPSEVHEPEDWSAVEQITTYLEALFDADENVGYVTETWEKDGKYMPSRGAYDRTAGQLIEELSRCNGDIGCVFGDYKEEAGAWIRFNPLDGKGVKNENVTDYRYALVESDTLPIEQQNSIIRALELPVACLVHSGKKSLHAIVHIDATNYNEYRSRVDYLYTVLDKNGLQVDKQNKNPSRLSRMPGVMRNGHKQYLIATHIGKSSWAEWKDYFDGLNDDMPDFEPEFMAELPPLAPPLIDGVLRQGHKMLISGPSKAGKSFALIELAICISEGLPWLGFSCARGDVLYVNLELDRASCLHRFADVRRAMGAPKKRGVTIWNLRGRSVPMDKLAPILIRRAAQHNYTAIIIDPIYKIVTGDENSADQMAQFCNQFDKVCTELGCAVIYCHHHSKGAQGGKRSMDRASGSGVFARDPDALLDMIQLPLSEEHIQAVVDKAVADAYLQWMQENVPDWDSRVTEEERCSAAKMRDIVDNLNLPKWRTDMARQTAQEAAKKASIRTAWRIDGTLREYPAFTPINAYFDYPIHRVDNTGALGDIEPEIAEPWRKNFTKSGKRQGTNESRKKSREEQFETFYASNKAFSHNGIVTVEDMAKSLGLTDRTIRDRVKQMSEKYKITENVIFEVG